MVLSEHTVVGTALAGRPADDGTVERLEVESDNDLVALLEVLHLAADADNVAGAVGAGDYVFLGSEGVVARRNHVVAIVQCHAADLDQDLAWTGLWDLLIFAHDVVDVLAVSTWETEDCLSGHNENNSIGFLETFSETILVQR